ncbi:long tail fiber distal subunit [Acinetobacter phage AC4]|nr:long tail fiber distal subunit [Acinetobacter phage AC4]
MALDPNINRIKFMRSKTAGAVPSPTLLDEGELAINLVDRTIFSKNGANTVELGFGKGGTVAGPINVTGDNAVTAAQFNGALNGNAATASRLLTGRKINNVVFDGTKDITIEDSTKLYKSDVLTAAGDSRVIRDAATIRAQGTAKGAVVIHLPKKANSVSTMMKLCIQGFDYVSRQATQSNWSVDISGYNYTGAAWHSYQAISTGGPAPFDTVRWGQAGDHQVIILGEAGASPSSWSYYNISIEKIYLTSNNTALYDDPNDPIYMAIEANISNYTINATMPLEGVAMAKRLETGRTFTFTGDARGSLSFDGTANVATALTINSATTGQAGLVKLNNTLTSTSDTEALTAAQGKALQDTKVNRSGDIISGRLVVTQGITTPSISNDVTVPISFLGPSVNNSNAGGIRVRNLEVNNQYGTATRAFGIFSKDGIVTGDSMSYSTLADLGTGDNIPFKVKDTNVGTTYGFVPFLGGSVQSSSGYRTVTSIGVYRPGSNWAGSGMYMALGGTDSASTEAFLFKLGRTISSTTGPVYLEGIADFSRNIDASSSMFASDGTIGWRKLGTATIPQSGRNVTIQLFGGIGFNAGAPSQAHPTTIVLKSGNGNPASINMVVNVNQKANILSNGGWTPGIGPSACFVKSTDPATPNDYDIYIHTGGYLYASVVVITGYQTSWVKDFQYTAVGAKPDGAVDAYVYNTLDSLDPEVFGAITFKNSVATPAKNTEYTKLSMIPPTHTGGTWLHRLNDTVSTAEYIIKYGPTPVLRMDSSGTVYTATLRNSGATHLGNQMELGNVGTASPVYIDFHSGASDIDYDARIMSSGGTTAIGNGELSYIAASHAFNGRVDGGLISASTGLGISNSSNTVLAGLSLYAGAQSGKPTYGITFTGTSNAGTGRHGDLTNATWAVYLTCATAGDEKRGWIFQRSDNNTNVASISTAGVLSTNGSIQTLSDNTMINVGNNSDLALVKKVSNSGFIGVGSTAGFAVKRSNATSVDPSNTFTDLFTVRANGDLDIKGNNVYIGNGINQNTYETIQFGNYNKAAGGGGFSVIHMAGVGSSGERVLQLANYTESNTIASALHVNNSGTYQIVGTTTLKLATIADNVASATKLQTARTFQITGGITTNAVSFDGQQNVTLTAFNVDGSKVTGKVPAAAQADNATNATKANTLDIAGQKEAKLVATWAGGVYVGYSQTAKYYSPTQIQIELGSGTVVQDRISRIKVGSLLHGVFAGSTGWSNGLSTGRIIQVTTNRVSGVIDAIVEIPHSISPGNVTSFIVLAVTYNSSNCSFIGNIAAYAKQDLGADSAWSWLLRTSTAINNPSVSISTSGDVATRDARLDLGWFLSGKNPIASSATMINSNTCNFIVSDNNNDVASNCGYISIQIWDVV